MFEILIATMIGAVALLWFSTKTENIAFQKMFAGLGILLFAVMFLQASILAPAYRISNETSVYEYENFTQPEAGKWEAEVVNITTSYEYENDPAGEVISGGNLALFIVFAFVFILSLIWFIIDYFGIALNDIGQIVRKRKPPKYKR